MTIALSSPPARDVVRLVRLGVGWWLGELTQMLPRRLSALFSGDADPVVLVTVSPAGAALWPADARSAAAGRRRSVTLAVDRSLIFEATLELPQAAAAALPQILRHQIERLVPLAAGETVFDYRAPPSTDGGPLPVRVFVAKRATIDEALAAARTAGLDPRRIVLAGWPGPGKPPLLWQPDNTTGTSRRLHRR